MDSPMVKIRSAEIAIALRGIFTGCSLEKDAALESREVYKSKSGEANDIRNLFLAAPFRMSLWPVFPAGGRPAARFARSSLPESQSGDGFSPVRLG
jgi:hypothetical protein